MEVNPIDSSQTVPEFISYAKANPGKINMASGGNGVLATSVRRVVQDDDRLSMVHVPYRGAAPALPDLLGGQVQVMFGSLPASIEYIRSGKLRPLAVTTATRSQALPDIPTVSEFVPATRSAHHMASARPGTRPVEIIERLNKEINASLANPSLAARFAELGAIPMPLTPDAYGKLIIDETEKWAKVVKFSGAKAD